MSRKRLSPKVLILAGYAREHAEQSAHARSERAALMTETDPLYRSVLISSIKLHQLSSRMAFIRRARMLEITEAII